MAIDDTVGPAPLPEWALDVLLWQELECNPSLAHWLVERAAGASAPPTVPTGVSCRPWHLRESGETDLLVEVAYGPRIVTLHIEDKISAPWSDETQAQRYRDAMRPDHDEHSVLLAPSYWFAARTREARLFSFALSFEALASQIEQEIGDDARQAWIALRLREAARPSVGASSVRADDLDAWALEFARLARPYGLQPRSGGFTRSADSDGRSGRFIGDEQVLAGPGSPYLVYKIGAPGARPTTVDLAWYEPDDRLRHQVVSAALADGFEITAAQTEIYVRIHGGEIFGSLAMQRPVEDQLSEAHATLSAARRLVEWWAEVGPSLGDLP